MELNTPKVLESWRKSLEVLTPTERAVRGVLVVRIPYASVQAASDDQGDLPMAIEFASRSTINPKWKRSALANDHNLRTLLATYDPTTQVLVAGILVQDATTRTTRGVGTGGAAIIGCVDL